MNRRHFLKSAAAIAVLPIGCSHVSTKPGIHVATGPSARRVRLGDPGWPSAARWDRLNLEVGGRLIKVQSPLAACRETPTSAECREFFRKLKNPYYIDDEPGLPQTSGWVGELRKVVANAGSCVSESDFFEHSWHQSFWGSNYPRLAAVKKKYDTAGLFFVHHGVGSEEWSADGFVQLAGR